MINVTASGDDPNRLLDVGRRLDERAVGDDDALLRDNPLLRAMGEVAREFRVSVTLSVYPADAPDVDPDVDPDVVNVSRVE